MDTGTRIKALRNALNWTQEKLAERAGIQRTEVTKLEGGGNKATSHEMHLAVARGFGLASSDLDLYLAGEMSVEAATEIALDEDSENAPASDGSTALAIAIHASFDPKRHLPADVSRAARASRTLGMKLANDAAVPVVARNYLEAARLARLAGEHRVSDIRDRYDVLMSRASASALAPIIEEANAAGDAELEALRNPPPKRKR